MPASFIIDRASNRQFYFLLQCSIGATLLTSYTFVFRISCFRAIDAVKTACMQDSNFQTGIATNKQYFFVLRGNDEEILGTSQYYNTIQLRDEAMNRVKKETAEALLQDRTIRQ